MKKIDLHLHMLPHPLGDMVATAEVMLPHMDRLGIEKGVLMSAGETQAQLGYNAGNLELCRAHPDRLAWMCNLDPAEPETVYDRLSCCKAQGAIGVGELMYNKPLDDPFLQAIFAAAEKLELPVTFHMSPEEGFNYGVVDRPGLPLLEKMLAKYPKLKFLGHSQVFWIEISADAPTDNKDRNSWGKGAVVSGGRVPELFEKYPNLYGDLSANSAGRAIMRDEEFGLAFLEKYADRLFFATDMLNDRAVMPLGGWLDDMLTQGRLSRESYEKIVAENARRIFGL